MFHLFLMLTWFCSVNVKQTTPTFSETFDRQTQVVRKSPGEDSPPLPPPYLHLPVFVDSRLPLVEKEHFIPTGGTGKEPLPEPMRRVLIPVEQNRNPPGVSEDSVVTSSCKFRKMHVQVHKSMLGTDDSQSRVRLGTCEANRSTRDYVHFEYDLSMCGTTRTISNNQVVYSNTLHSDPARIKGPIRRAVPFTLPVACYFNRFQYSYKIGYKPTMQIHKIIKPMSNMRFSLTPRNAQWEMIPPSEQYVLGEPMYFEAETLSVFPNQRLYVLFCYVTPHRSHTSTPQVPVVTNYGCMAESKQGRSRFLPQKNNAVRFTVDAFLFKGMTGQQLYMHCNMAVGSSDPTHIAKSCNYNTEAKRWVELYGPASVCSCCDASCSSAPSKKAKIISSRPWTIEPIEPTVKPIASHKSKKTKNKMATTITATPPRTQKTVTECTTVLKPRVRAWSRKGKVGKVWGTVKEVPRPLVGGGRERWIEMEDDETEVTGSAAVEEEVITISRSMFSEIFDIDE